jgi:hypothetical protein
MSILSLLDLFSWKKSYLHLSFPRERSERKFSAFSPLLGDPNSFSPLLSPHFSSSLSLLSSSISTYGVRF